MPNNVVWSSNLSLMKWATIASNVVEFGEVQVSKDRCFLKGVDASVLWRTAFSSLYRVAVFRRIVSPDAGIQGASCWLNVWKSLRRYGFSMALKGWSLLTIQERTRSVTISAVGFVTGVATAAARCKSRTVDILSFFVGWSFFAGSKWRCSS